MMWHNTGEHLRLRGHRMSHIGNIDQFRLGGSDTQDTWQYHILLFIITSFDLIFAGIADWTLVSIFAFVCFIEYVYFKPIHMDFELFSNNFFSICDSNRMGQTGIEPIDFISVRNSFNSMIWTNINGDKTHLTFKCEPHVLSNSFSHQTSRGPTEADKNLFTCFYVIYRLLFHCVSMLCVFCMRPSCDQKQSLCHFETI